MKIRNILFATAIAVGALPAAQAANHPSANNDPPTVVLVHGAFADASSWNRVIPFLKRSGMEVIAVDAPLTSLQDDVVATRRAIESAPGKVVLVGHSWGGTVITEAGVDDKVSALVYVAAFAPAIGENTADQGKGYPAPPGGAHLQDRNGLLWLSEVGAREDFAPDLGAQGAAQVFAAQRPIKASAFSEPVTHAAWQSKPSWYVASRQDRMIAPELEGATAQRIRARLEWVNSGHASPLSQPAEVANAILEAAGMKKSAKTSRSGH